MLNEQVREKIASYNEDALLFDNPSFDNSIIGFNALTDSVVYDYDLMVQELANEYFNDEKYREMFDDIEKNEEEFKQQCVEDAMEFIEFNTLRALPYFSNEDGVPPTVIFVDYDFVGGFSGENSTLSKENSTLDIEEPQVGG